MFSSIKIPHVRNYFLYFMKSLLLEMSLSKWIAPFTTHEDVIATILSLLAFHIQPKSRLCVFMFKILHDFCLTSFGFFFLGILPAVVVFSIPLWLLMLSLKKKKKKIDLVFLPLTRKTFSLLDTTILISYNKVLPSLGHTEEVDCPSRVPGFILEEIRRGTYFAFSLQIPVLQCPKLFFLNLFWNKAA